MEEKGGVGEKGRDGKDVCDMLNVCVTKNIFYYLSNISTAVFLPAFCPSPPYTSTPPLLRQDPMLLGPISLSVTLLVW